MNEIIKPVTLVRQEFINDITKLINESSLPAFVIEDILEKILKQVHDLTNIQYEQEKKRYEELISENSENNN